MTQFFGEKILFVTKYFFSFSAQLFSETFLIPGRIYCDIINVRMSSCNLLIYSCQILIKIDFLDRF